MITDSHKFFFELITGYRKAKTVFAAHELGIFPLLESGGLSASAVAERLSYDQRATEILLRALVSIELLTHDEGIFSNSETATRHFVPGRKEYAGNNLSFQNQIWDLWGELENVVKTGAPNQSLAGLLEDHDQTFTREYIKGMDIVAMKPAALMAKLISDQRPVSRMLDLGGGPGTYARAMLEANPDARATLFDLKTTLEITTELWANSPLKDRLTLQQGDYLKDTFGDAGYDFALLSHITHDESPETNASLLKKTFTALAPRGRVAIHDFVVDEDGCGPLFSALFSVNMLAYTKGGRVYSRSEYVGMLLAAGFTNVAVHDLLPEVLSNPTALIVAER